MLNGTLSLRASTTISVLERTLKRPKFRIVSQVAPDKPGCLRAQTISWREK